MRHRSRLASIVTALLMVASLLAGSGLTAALADSSAQNPEFVELKMVMVGPEMDSYQRIMPLVNEKLKQDLNCTLTVEFLDWSDWLTKYPLMFASGEEFDLVYTSNWAMYSDQARKGAFLEITMEDVEKYMPRINANITEEMWNGTLIDDKIFMIPQSGLQFTGDHNLFLVRGDLMEKYGIAEIKNAEDLMHYWEQVTVNDPHMIPIPVNNTWSGAWVTTAVLGYPWLGENWGNGVYQVYDLTDPNNIKAVPDEEYWEFNTQRYKLAKEFLEKGFWSRDALAQEDDVRTMFVNGIGASTIGAIVDLNGTYEQVNAEHPDWKVQIVDITPELGAVYYPVTGDGMAIHATTKHKERAMQVLDLISYDQEYYDLIYYGVEGVDYTLNADGSYTWTGKVVNVGFRGMNNKIARLSTTVAPNFKEIIDRFNSVAYYIKTSNFNFDNSKVLTQVAAIADMGQTYDTIAHLGFIDGDVDTYVAQFRKALEDADLKGYQDALTEQLQVYMSTYYN